MKTIEITVASNMSDATYSRICSGFRKKYGECKFERIVDDRIIGGFSADVDGEVFDLSISSQLEKMKKQITK